MKKVIIASRNPVKIQATQLAFQKMFPKQKFEFQGRAVSSQVSDQPLNSQETFLGAQNRVKQISQEVPDADFYVGIEGGIEIIFQDSQEEMENFAWVIIRSAQKIGRARTGTFFLPPQIMELIKAGKELGEADDIVFKRYNSKQMNGASGILTGNALDRKTYYVEAIILALIPFKNPDLYQ